MEEVAVDEGGVLGCGLEAAYAGVDGVGEGGIVFIDYPRLELGEGNGGRDVDIGIVLGKMSCFCGVYDRSRHLPHGRQHEKLLGAVNRVVAYVDCVADFMREITQSLGCGGVFHCPYLLAREVEARADGGVEAYEHLIVEIDRLGEAEILPAGGGDREVGDDHVVDSALEIVESLID